MNTTPANTTTRATDIDMVDMRLLNRLNGKHETAEPVEPKFPSDTTPEQLVEHFVQQGLSALDADTLVLLLDDQVFDEDHRIRNASLHRLYVQTAVKHQALIFRHLREVAECANLTMHPLQDAITEFLIRKAFSDAAWCEGLVCTLAAHEGRYPLGDDE